MPKQEGDDLLGGDEDSWRGNLAIEIPGTPNDKRKSRTYLNVRLF